MGGSQFCGERLSAIKVMSNPREFFLIISNTSLQKVIRIILTGKEVRILIFKRNQTFFIEKIERQQLQYYQIYIKQDRTLKPL